jgi:hypothetical protein
VEDDLSLTSKRWGLPEVCERKSTPASLKREDSYRRNFFPIFSFFFQKESSSILILTEDFLSFFYVSPNGHTKKEK